MFLELVCFVLRFLDLYDGLRGECGVNESYEKKADHWWFKG